MYEYQQHRRYFAQVAHHLEETGAEELRALGATDVETAYRGLYFTADRAALYRINYCSRLVTRVLAPLLTFDCHSDRYLYNTAREIDWADFLTPDQTFAVFANVSHSQIDHSKYAALKLKDAIADAFREQFGRRPDVDTDAPDVWFNLYIQNDRAVISLDTSGGSLHRRGYREEAVTAPMQETVAAACVRWSEWDAGRPLHDIMCGSGTLLLEAHMHGCRIPAAYLQDRFGFEQAPDYDAETWARVRREANDAIRPLPEGLLHGNDRSAEAVAHARTNAARLPHTETITWTVQDFRSLPPIADATILCNPPYGIRMGKGQNLNRFYRELGDFLKQKCTGSTAYIYFGERTYIKKIGLRTSFKNPLVNGALEGRLCKYEMY